VVVDVDRARTRAGAVLAMATRTVAVARVVVVAVAAVPSRHYVGRMGYHIYGWSARQCRIHLGYIRKVKHQMSIFQITTLVHLQSTVHLKYVREFRNFWP
jgi:hypothetical protein